MTQKKPSTGSLATRTIHTKKHFSIITVEWTTITNTHFQTEFFQFVSVSTSTKASENARLPDGGSLAFFFSFYKVGMYQGVPLTGHSLIINCILLGNILLCCLMLH